MSIPILNYVLQASGSWLVTWQNVGAAFYRVVLFGLELAKVTGTSWVYSGNYASFPPPLEITSGNALALSEQFPPYVIIQWYGQDTDFYQVSQYIASAWVPQQVFREVGLWIYTYVSGSQPDEITQQWQVSALDSLGNPSTPLSFSQYVVTPPASPDGAVSIGYNSGNLVIAQE